MRTPLTDAGRWIKSSKSNTDGSCVEMRRPEDAVQIRDTKQNGLGPILTMDRLAFGAWLNSAKTGELDHLLAP
jgi:hypothetical protein